MKLIPRADAERAMKVQEVILRATAKSITWWQAAEILDLSVRQMRRWRRRYERFVYDGLWDRRRGRVQDNPPSPRVQRTQSEERPTREDGVWDPQAFAIAKTKLGDKREPHPPQVDVNIAF
jgi:hypothetical protein